jgi:glycerophosphoryl diester phosphodiesterase
VAAPENTLAAFERGITDGANGLELDVHLSRDGVPVVHHDAQLERTTNLVGAIDRYTADELARADAAYHFRGRGDFPFRGQGLGVPTLDTVLRRFTDVPIIVELKDNEPALASRTVEVIRRAGAVERVCLGSFGLRVLRAARAADAAIATSAAREEVRWALYRTWCRWPPSNVPYQSYQVPEWAGWTRVVSPRFIRGAHASGVQVQVWTVNLESDAERLLSWGVDALITDRPDVIVPLARRAERAP